MSQEEINLSLEQSIIAEGNRLRKEEPDEWPGFLNNFWAEIIPEDNGKFISGREKEKTLGWWDKKLGDVIREENKDRYSVLRLSQTGEEYYQTIDRVIKEVDTTGEIAQAIADLSEVSCYEERVKAQDKLEEKIIPVFARLIAMGYNAKELQG